MVVAAINDSVIIPHNPSMALTGVVVTTTFNPDQRGYNSTGYDVEQDEIEYRVVDQSEMQTVMLACFCTVIPLFIIWGGFAVLRLLWLKYNGRRDQTVNLVWYDGVGTRDNAPGSPHKCVSNQQSLQILSAQELVNGGNGPKYICETEVMDNMEIVTSSDDFPPSEKHTSKNANGNIITLTLKNNHLIVETEERMTSLEDNSVVVEMQPIYAKDDINIHISSIDDVIGGVTNQQAMVHREEMLDDFSADFESSKLFGSINTGLSQSDLSISSYGSVNHGYRYGNQVEYDAVQLGYALHETSDYYGVPLSSKLDGSSKWVEFDKSPDTDSTALNNTVNMNKNTSDYKKPSNSLDSGSSLEHQDTTDTNSSPDTLRCNNNFQTINDTTLINMKPMTPKCLINDYSSPECNKPVITGALFKDEMPEQEKMQRLIKSNTFQDESTNLDSGCLSIDQKNTEVRKQKFESSAFVSTHKRNNSISPRFIEDIRDNEQKESIDVYNQIETSTLSDFSPKITIFQNENGQIDTKKS